MFDKRLAHAARDHGSCTTHYRSPFEKIVEWNGCVATLGAMHPDKRTVNYGRQMPQGWIEFEEFDTGDPAHPRLPENAFELALDYLASGAGRASGYSPRKNGLRFFSRSIVVLAS